MEVEEEQDGTIIIMISKKNRWMTIHYKRGDLLPNDIDEKIDHYRRMWGIPASWEMPEDLKRNIEMIMYDQIQGSRVNQSKGRGAYDWNARIDLANDVVQLQQIGFDELDKNQRFVLDKTGLHVATEEDEESYSYDELKNMIRDKIKSWADISLMYSVGGVADSIKLSK